MTYSYHFTEQDIAIPRGSTVKDLDWTAIAWDLATTPGPDRMPQFAQVILCPGVVASRTGMLTEATYGLWDQDYKYVALHRLRDDRTVYELALEKTQLFLDEGYSWVQEPFVVDFTGIEIRQKMTEKIDPRFSVEVETLGSALIKANNPAIMLFFNHVRKARDEQLRRPTER